MKTAFLVLITALTAPVAHATSWLGGWWEGSGTAVDSMGWKSSCQVLSYEFSSTQDTLTIDDGQFFCGGLAVRSYFYELGLRGSEILRNDQRVGQWNDSQLQLSLVEDELEKKISISQSPSHPESIHLVEEWLVNGRMKYRFEGDLTRHGRK